MRSASSRKGFAEALSPEPRLSSDKVERALLQSTRKRMSESTRNLLQAHSDDEGFIERNAVLAAASGRRAAAVAAVAQVVGEPGPEPAGVPGGLHAGPAEPARRRGAQGRVAAGERPRERGPGRRSADSSDIAVVVDEAPAKRVPGPSSMPRRRSFVSMGVGEGAQDPAPAPPVQRRDLFEPGDRVEDRYVGDVDPVYVEKFVGKGSFGSVFVVRVGDLALESTTRRLRGARLLRNAPGDALAARSSSPPPEKRPSEKKQRVNARRRRRPTRRASVQGALSLEHAVSLSRAADDALLESATLQLYCGLDHMHRHGVMHQDIKPANVMIRRDGLVQITDLGLSPRTFWTDSDPHTTYKGRTLAANASRTSTGGPSTTAGRAAEPRDAANRAGREAGAHAWAAPRVAAWARGALSEPVAAAIARAKLDGSRLCSTPSRLHGVARAQPDGRPCKLLDALKVDTAVTRGVARFAMPSVVAEMIAPRASGTARSPLLGARRAVDGDRDDAARLAAAAEWCGISGDASRDAALEAYCAALREARSDHALDVSLRNRASGARADARAVFDAALAAATGSGGFRTLTAIDCSHCRSLRVDTRRLFEALALAPIRVVDLNYAHGVAGPLPDAIGRLAKLEILTLRECTSIVGPVPDALGARAGGPLRAPAPGLHGAHGRAAALPRAVGVVGAPGPGRVRAPRRAPADARADLRQAQSRVLLDGSPRADVDLALALEEDDGLVRGLAHGVEAEDPLGGAGFEPLEPRRWRRPDLLALPALEQLVLTDCVRARGPLTSAALRARDEAGSWSPAARSRSWTCGVGAEFAGRRRRRRAQAKRRGIQVLLSPGDEELLSRALRDDEDAHLEPPSPFAFVECDAPPATCAVEWRGAAESCVVAGGARHWAVHEHFRVAAGLGSSRCPGDSGSPCRAFESRGACLDYCWAGSESGDAEACPEGCRTARDKVSRLVAATMGLALAPLPGAILFLVLVMRDAAGALVPPSPRVALRQLFELADLSRVDPCVEINCWFGSSRPNFEIL
ncbi:hypothetical protein SO694_0005107 [Aureococcus anophagefferens]|uniref:Protein kinase domain-containing protein n=1 Tax=Aureococcus anophagefferens TaxID=44056 RepID=A0ABR1FY78_AURAN